MILNLTQHEATPEQEEAGVKDLPVRAREELKNLLTFNQIPDREQLWDRAREVVKLAAEHQGHDQVMLGGAPFFMSVLEAELEDEGFTPMYAFSERVSMEQIQDDGSVRKTNVFKHIGFVST